MKTHRLLVLAVLPLLVPSFASAQDDAAVATPSAVVVVESDALPSAAEAPSAPASISPGFRLDFVIPAFGIGWFTAPVSGYEETIGVMAFDVRFVESHGHGALARVAYGSNGWGGGTAVDLDYVYRARLVGDDRFGLGLDLMAGGTVASLSHNEGTIPTGLAMGGNAGLSLDLRAYNFVVSLSGQYRLLVPDGAALNGGSSGPEHALTATLGLGFGFWGT